MKLNQHLLKFAGVLILTLGFSCATPVSEDTKGSVTEKEGDWEGCAVGAYIEVGDMRFPADDTKGLEMFDTLIGKELGIPVWYPTWDESFPTEHCKMVQARGGIPHLTWEIFWPSTGEFHYRAIEDTSTTGLGDVLRGEYDAYIDSFAMACKEFGGKVLIRFMHEFNGNWYTWSGNKNGRENGGPEKVVKTWKYVVDRFRAVGADNAKWLWNPHGPSTDVSTEEWNNISNYWPGEEYVDWIGMDAYNWYPRDPWGGPRPYRSFDNCFRNLYDSCLALPGDHPIIIAEFASAPFEYEGLTKADWIRDAFTKIKTEYPRIKAFTWFHINKELDWRVNSSPEALTAFREMMADPYYIGNPYKKEAESTEEH